MVLFYVAIHKLLVEDGPKAAFSTAIIPRCREGRNSFLGIAPLTIVLNLTMLSVKQECIK